MPDINDILRRAIQLHHEAQQVPDLEREYTINYQNTDGTRYTLVLIFDGDNIEMHTTIETNGLELGLEAE